MCVCVCVCVCVSETITIAGAGNGGAARRLDKRNKVLIFKIVNHSLTA